MGNNKPYVYAKVGEKLTVIEDKGNCLLVKDSKGNIFSTMTENVELLK